MQGKTSRRSALGTGLALIVATGVAAIGNSATALASQVAPSTVAYQPTPKDGKQCSGCAQFVAPGSCKVVSGAISPAGWCSLFAAKSA